MEFEDDCDGVHVSSHVDKILEFIDTYIDISSSLEIIFQLQSH
jgi:hypothetical protein